MSIIKNESSKKVIASGALKKLSPVAQGALMVTASGVAWAIKAGAKAAVQRAINRVGRSAEKAITQTDASPAKGNAGMLRVSKRRFLRMPDGRTIEEGVEYTVQYAQQGDDPVDINLTIKD